MKKDRIKFGEYPSVVRYAISLTIFAWILFLVTSIVSTGTVSIFHMTMGMFVCFAVLSLRRWSRIFVSLYNLLMAIMIGREVYYIFAGGNPVFTISLPLKIICVMLFAVTAILLLSGRSKEFFTKHAG